MKIIEFMGLPEAGKSEHTDKLERDLRAKGYKVYKISDLIKGAPPSLADEVSKNRWALNEIDSQIVLARQVDLDVVLIDRGFWAHFASLEAISREGKIIKELAKEKEVNKEEVIAEIRRIQDLAVIQSVVEDFYIFIGVSPKIALERDQKPSKVHRYGTIIAPGILKEMKEVYEELLQSSLQDDRLLIVDGEGDFEKNRKKILKIVCRLIAGGKTDAASTAKNRGKAWEKETIIQ